MKLIIPWKHIIPVLVSILINCPNTLSLLPPLPTLPSVPLPAALPAPLPSMPLPSPSCEGQVSPELKKEIQGYQEIAKKIIDKVVSGDYKGIVYKRLAEFVDNYGPRPIGSQTLEKSIDYLMEKMKNDGLENVKEEEVTAGHWQRGTESGMLLTPKEKPLSLLGLGGSVPTPPEGITAPAIVVKTFEELNKRSSEIPGKIVVFNQKFGPTYHDSAPFRKLGAMYAAKLGAVGSLVRSITPFSINSPHTGSVFYEKGTPQIPAAAITVEDAELLNRLDARGEKLTINFILNNKYTEQTISRNSMGDLTGREKPEKLVLVGCHIDSWDVGQGAMDDAGGCFLAMEMHNVLRAFDLRPRRTLRTILFTAEEIGLVGVKQYIDKHVDNLKNINAFMESDFGTFKPTGLNFAGADKARCILKEVMGLFKEVGATDVNYTNQTGGDTDAFIPTDVPTIALQADQGKYLWFHHTQADTMTVNNPDEMDLCLAVWTAASYVIADLSVDLPRKVK